MIVVSLFMIVFVVLYDIHTATFLIFSFTLRLCSHSMAVAAAKYSSVDLKTPNMLSGPILYNFDSPRIRHDYRFDIIDFRQQPV